MDVAKIFDLFLSFLFISDIGDVIRFAWGTPADEGLSVLKRVFLVLPILGIALGYWASVLGVLSLPIRADRQRFLNSLLMTWWDLGQAILHFWGGVASFVLRLTVTLFGLVRLLLVGLWMALQDIVLVPFRMVSSVGSSALNPSVPWIAVALTLGWCFLEAGIFTYVCSPLVIDTLGNIVGENLTEASVRIPLFFFMLFLVLGSYSVLSSWTDAMKSKDVPAMVKIGIIEFVALSVEVVFLYREFVDALVPWFAQHSTDDFSLGVFGTLFIASFTWFGIRGMTWFLFGSAGTPTLMAIIQGSGLKGFKSKGFGEIKTSFHVLDELVRRIRSEMEWVRKEREELIASLLLPPLQVLAAAINFCTLLLTKQHSFRLPLRRLEDLRPVDTVPSPVGQIVRPTQGSGTGSDRKAA